MIGEGDAAALKDCLASGGVAVFPTDTVYGIGCSAHDDDAWRRIELIKGRLQNKPAAVLFFSVEAAEPVLGRLVGRTLAAARTLLPGPVTLVLPDPGGFESIARGGRLGLRVPRLEIHARALVDLDVPLLQTSANLAGGADPEVLQHVPWEMREAVDLQLDGGILPGTASTVVDLSDFELTGKWRMLREGMVSESELARLLSD